VSCVRRWLLAFRGCLSSTLSLVGSAMLIFLVFYVAFCLLCLSSSCVLCTQCRQFLWIVFVVCLVYPMSPVSLDCLRRVSCVPNVASFSGLSSSCVLCTQCRQFLWIVFVVCLVYPMLPVSLDCPFLIAPSVFSSGFFFLNRLLRNRFDDWTVIINSFLLIELCNYSKKPFGY
jgi:hypothetical protein